jgi:hypothetical protein
MSFVRNGSKSHRLRSSRAQRLLRIESLEARRVLAAAIDSVVWQNVDSTEPFRGTSYITAVDYDLYRLDQAALTAGLAGAPAETAVSVDRPSIALPRPDGDFETFEFVSSPIYAPEFAAKFPGIQTYLGYSLDNPGSTVRFDFTPQGFHAQVLSPQGNYLIDPYFHLSDSSLYATYFMGGEQDLSKLGPDLRGAQPDVLESIDDLRADDDEQLDVAGFDVAGLSSGSELRTYRTAIAAAAEFTAFHGGTVALGQAAIVTTMNRVNGVLENELSVRFELVANNDLLVFTNAATDPYSAGGLFPNLSENQATIDGIIGVANYDVGHLFTATQGRSGLAFLRSVGVDSLKASAATSGGPPVGEFFYTVVMHEIGHQMGANHTFSGDSGGCSGNINRNTAVEPGGGSTIMSYAGICGNDDIAPNMDANYHSLSVDEILAHLDGNVASVGRRTTPLNAIPLVDAGADFTIPSSTPFVLTANGFDSNSGNLLTYSWEQRDTGPQRDLAAGDDGVSTLFRVYPPVPNPARYFPRLEDLVNNTLSPGEKYATTNRAMNFRVTVRDNHVGAGAINTDDMRITVVDTGAPFRVTSANAAQVWDGLSLQTITWDVAATDVAPISSADVDIYFSADGGLTYPFLVESNLPNTGSAQIFVPNVDTTQGRIMVRGANHVFFDINDVDITVNALPIEVTIDSGPAVYTENQPAIPVSPNAAVLSTANLAGLTIDISIAQGAETGDLLTILGSNISIGGGALFYNGVNIGSISFSSQNFSVRLNSNSSGPAIEAFVRSIGFANTTDSPTASPRTVSFVFGSTITHTRRIDVVPVNDSPSVSDTVLPAILEDILAPEGSLISDIMLGSFSDPDSGSSISGVVVVDNPLVSSLATWYYSTDAVLWIPIGSVNDADESLVLPANAYVGFLPEPDYFGVPQSLVVRVLDDSYTGAFSNPSTGTVVFLDALDRTPDGPLSASTAELGIVVQNVNDAPFANQPLIAINLLQDQPIDQVFSDSLFGDVDSPVLDFSVVTASGGVLPAWLSFDALTKTISGTPRNRDVGTYNLILRATDAEFATAEIPVVVTVANVNDAPINLRFTGSSVAENRSNVIIGDLFATDPDPGDLVFWSSSDPRFIITDNRLVLTTELDFETEQVIHLVLTAVDSGFASSAMNVALKVTDENEFFPQLAGEAFSIPDGTPQGTLLRTLTAPDLDTQQTVRFRLKSGDVSQFTVDPVSGELWLAQTANRVVQSTYTVFIEAYDNGTPFKARTSQFTVNVVPVNLFPPTLPITQTFSLNENSPAETLVGQVSAQDLDGAGLTFAIASETAGEEGWVEIDSQTGALSTTAIANYDFENQSTHQVVVRVTETVDPFRTAAGIVILQVIDVNDPPTAISPYTVPTSQMGYPTTSGFTVTDQDPAIGYVLATSDARFEIRDGALALRPEFFFADSLAGTTTQLIVSLTDVDDGSVTSLPLQVNIVANPAPWQNKVLNFDVNRSGSVSAGDVLAVVIAINEAGGQTLALSRPRTLEEYSLPDVDVSGDNLLTAIDALLVVNYVNENPSGEGESKRVEAASEDLVWLSAFTALEEEIKRRRS